MERGAWWTKVHGVAKMATVIEHGWNASLTTESIFLIKKKKKEHPSKGIFSNCAMKNKNSEYKLNNDHPAQESISCLSILVTNFHLSRFPNIQPLLLNDVFFLFMNILLLDFFF